MHACPNTPASTHVVRLAMERAELTPGSPRRVHWPQGPCGPSHLTVMALCGPRHSMATRCCTVPATGAHGHRPCSTAEARPPAGPHLQHLEEARQKQHDVQHAAGVSCIRFLQLAATRAQGIDVAAAAEHGWSTPWPGRGGPVRPTPIQPLHVRAREHLRARPDPHAGGHGSRHSAEGRRHPVLAILACVVQVPVD